MLSRRRHKLVLVAAHGAIAASVSVVPAQARAQTGCVVSPSSFGSAADVCRKANDLFRFLIPQVGVAVAGGNPVPGEGGTMGGFGKRAISVRVIGVDGRLPKNSVALNLTGAAVASDFGATRTVVPLPAADAAIGLTSGIPLGLTNVGGVDLLVGATILPKVSQNAFQLEPKGSGGVALSYGVRVGALQESSLVPGVSVSYMRRKLPKVDLGYTPGNDTLRVANTLVRASSIRIVASKRLPLLGFAAGVGRDVIEGSSEINAVVNETVAGSAQRATVTLPLLAEKVTRNTAFVNVSVSLLITRLVAVWGGVRRAMRVPRSTASVDTKPTKAIATPRSVSRRASRPCGWCSPKCHRIGFVT